MYKILKLPEYSHLSEDPLLRREKGGEIIYPGGSQSIRFLDKLYSEIMPVFDSEDFNVCCDETPELGKGRSKKCVAVRDFPVSMLSFRISCISYVTSTTKG